MYLKTEFFLSDRLFKIKFLKKPFLVGLKISLATSNNYKTIYHILLPSNLLGLLQREISERIEFDQFRVSSYFLLH